MQEWKLEIRVTTNTLENIDQRYVLEAIRDLLEEFEGGKAEVETITEL